MSGNNMNLGNNGHAAAAAGPAADEIRRQDILQTIEQYLKHPSFEFSADEIEYILQNYVSYFIDEGIPEDFIIVILEDPSASLLIRQGENPQLVLDLFQKNTSDSYENPFNSIGYRARVRGDHRLGPVDDPEFDGIEEHLTTIVEQMQYDPNNELLYPIYKMARQIATIEPSLNADCKALLTTILDQITQTKTLNGRDLAPIDPDMVARHLTDFIDKIIPETTIQELNRIEGGLDHIRAIVNPIMEFADTYIDRFEKFVAPFAEAMGAKLNIINQITKNNIVNAIRTSRNVAADQLQKMVYIDMIYGLDMSYTTAFNIYRNSDKIYQYLVAAPGGIVESSVVIVGDLANLLAGNIQSVREFYAYAASMGAGIPFNIFLFCLSLSSILYRESIDKSYGDASYHIAEKIRSSRNVLMRSGEALKHLMDSKGASNLTNAIFITFRVSKQLAMMYYGTSPYLFMGFTCHVLYHFIESFQDGKNTVTISKQILASAEVIFGDLIPTTVEQIQAIITDVQGEVSRQDEEARAELLAEIEAYMREEESGASGGAKRRISHKKSKKHHTKKHHSKKHHSKKHHSKKHHSKKHAMHKKRATKKHPVKKHVAKKRKTISKKHAKKHAKKTKHTKRQRGGVHNGYH